MASKHLPPAAIDNTMSTKDAENSVGQSGDTDGASNITKEKAMTSNKRTHSNDKEEEGNTTPPSKTLKHTSIQDLTDSGDMVGSVGDTEAGVVQNDKSEAASTASLTPEPSDSKDEEMKERMASPKKKRGREQEDDDTKHSEDKAELNDEQHAGTNGTATNGSRTTRLAPEKKRPRDTSAARGQEKDESEAKLSDQTDVRPQIDSIQASSEEAPKVLATPTSTTNTSKAEDDKPQTSSSAFAKSGFGSLSAAPSGFAALAGKTSVFGGGGGGVATAPAGFGALASNSSSTPAAPKAALSFGGSSSLATGGFASASTGGFGGLGNSSGGFGGGFGGGFAAPAGKLSSFAAAGKPDSTTAEKPARAFGAPESDAEDGSDEEGSDNENASDDEPSATLSEKKVKLTKVSVNDGEAGEATLLQFRAKLFWIDAKASGWKERGVGTLKLLAPKSTVSYGSDGLPILGSYDPSAAGEDEETDSVPEHTAARLVMRQENTHRVILNTPIIKAIKFEEKSSNSAIQILFTAFEEGKPVNMLLKMSETNARLFKSEITSIQKEL